MLLNFDVIVIFSKILILRHSLEYYLCIKIYFLWSAQPTYQKFAFWTGRDAWKERKCELASWSGNLLSVVCINVNKQNLIFFIFILLGKKTNLWICFYLLFNTPAGSFCLYITGV